MAVVREFSMATSVAHVCGQDLPEALQLLTDGAIASVVLEAVIGLEDLVNDGLEAIVSRRARGKILVSPSQ
jgi:(R,R)-butanediol dehydrogenase/meso-butanediol dehydrogenase/diacetyl reductase